MSLAELAPGFADPVHDAQHVFRALLDATARPGRIQLLDARVPPESPGLGIGAGMAAALLTLLDAETSLWLGAGHDRPALRDFLRFHTGVVLRPAAAQAQFAALTGEGASPALLASLCAGSDESPQDSATLLIEVAALASPEDGAQAGASACRLTLRGPGIEHAHSLAVDGVAAGFWRARIAQQAVFPCGVDLLLLCGARLAAIPRSTQLSLEG